MRLFGFGNHDAILLTQPDAPNLQTLIEQCPDYYQMAEGNPPSPTAAQKELNDRPPNGAPENAFCTGLYKSEILFGVLQAFRHYPRPNEWYLALLLLAPPFRGNNLGAAAYQAFESWAQAAGAEKILLAVLEPNQRAKKFWERQGFILPRCYPAIELGRRRHIIIEYEKRL